MDVVKRKSYSLSNASDWQNVKVGLQVSERMGKESGKNELLDFSLGNRKSYRLSKASDRQI